VGRSGSHETSFHSLIKLVIKLLDNNFGDESWTLCLLQQASTVHSELAVAVRKIMHIVEAFAQATGSDYGALTSNEPEMAAGEVALQFEWENLALDNMMRNLTHVSNRFLQGKYDLIDFVTELGTALDFILALKPMDFARHEAPESNNTVLASAQQELERLKSEKAETESHLALATEQVEQLKAQLHEGKQLVAGRRIHHDQVIPRLLHRIKETEIISSRKLVLGKHISNGWLFFMVTEFKLWYSVLGAGR
jgi:hypothetical protein